LATSTNAGRKKGTQLNSEDLYSELSCVPLHSPENLIHHPRKVDGVLPGHPGRDGGKHTDRRIPDAPEIRRSRRLVISSVSTMGHRHIPRPDDYPVMSAAYGFLLKPSGFFSKNPANDLPSFAKKPGDQTCCHWPGGR
jgi:hypothetical protein